MKTAIYIVDGSMQLVITPESDFEKRALDTFSDKQFISSIKRGSFYRCQGGWHRMSENDDNSLFLIADAAQED